VNDHPRAIAARLKGQHKKAAKVSGLTVAEVLSIHNVQRERAAQRLHVDPLIGKQRTRALRLRMARERRADDAAQAVRATLVRAAAIARSLGFSVRSSKMHGRVSSYYAERDGVTLRISDHDIPETPERAHAAGGYYDGYRGRWLKIDRPRSDLWLRRAVQLAADGRSVPGNDR
jgi:hypothetical protein